MTNDTPDLQRIPQSSETRSVVQRLEELEIQNRRIKLAGVVILLLFSAVFLTAQRSGRRTVEANEFVLIDDHGAKRADLSTTGAPGLALYDTRGNVRALLAMNEGGPYLMLNATDAKKGPNLSIDSQSLLLKRGAVSEVLVTADDKGPLLTLRGDKPSLRLTGEGFQTIVGSADLVTPSTGDTRTTSAASVIRFGKDHKVLWSAP